MATGVRVETLESFDLPNTAPVAELRVVPGPVVYANDIDEVLTGPFIEVLIDQSETSGVVSGQRNWSFIEDFYFRIYLSPIELAYGSFSQDKTLQMRIWNAYFSDVSFTDAQAIGTDVVLDQFAQLPINFGPLEYRSVSFTADGDGDTVLSDRFLLTFDTENTVDDVLYVPVSGFRVPQLTDLTWQYPPNWAQEYEVEYEFKTDVITSANGREQRRQVRQTPRRTSKFNIGLLSNTKRREFNKIMVGAQSARFFVPEYTRYVTTTTLMGPNEIEVDIDQLPPWWFEHDNYVILKYGDQWSLRKVDSVGYESNSNLQTVIFKSDDELSWPVGTRIYRALSSWASEEISGNMLTNTIQTAAMTFVTLPGSEAIEPPSSPLNTYDGRELWLKKPNWADPPTITHFQPATLLDVGQGRMERVKEIEHQTQRLVLTYVGRNFAGSEELRQFFFRCAGQCHEFYMPTWQDDITLRDPVEAVDTQVVIAGIDFASFYSQDPVRVGGAIAFLMNDGTIHYVNTLSIFAAEDSNDEPISVIELQTALGFTAALDEIERICWVPLWRMATDTMTVKWLTSAVCEVNFTVQTQPWFPADLGDSNSIFDSNSQSGSI